MKEIKKILITGVAGFIGFHLAKRLINENIKVVGIDNLNDYYDVNLKKDRLKELDKDKNAKNFKFIFCDLSDTNTILSLFKNEQFSHVVNLAAQAGVRYSLINPASYINSNLTGFANILEGCRHNKIKHLIFASSSSVYGMNALRPYSVNHNVDHPVSLYAATKKSNELMAHSYSHLYDLPSTGLRFFTVYGPWGRPDMALQIFTKAIFENKPIDIFNNGKMLRDFTYIDDIIEGIVRLLPIIPTPDPNFDKKNPNPATSTAKWRIYNIGNNHAIELEHFVDVLENALNKKAIRNYLPMQMGDVEATWADIDDLTKITGFTPNTKLEDGIFHFAKWYRDYYHV